MFYYMYYILVRNILYLLLYGLILQYNNLNYYIVTYYKQISYKGYE